MGASRLRRGSSVETATRARYDCDKDLNNNERVSGEFKLQRQQTALAALSLGPIGLADQLSGRPEDADVAITTNVQLANATCDASGMLIGPSFPLTPGERTAIGSGGAGDCFTDATHRSYTWGCGVHVWATHTTVSDTTWFTALPFLAGKASPDTQNITLFARGVSIDLFAATTCP